MTWVLMALFKVRSLATQGFAWLTVSTMHLMIAMSVILAAWGVYQHHEAAKYHRAYDSASAALKSVDTASKAELARATKERDTAIKQEKDNNDATDKRVVIAAPDDARRLADYERGLREVHRRDREKLPVSAETPVVESSDSGGSAAKLDAQLSADLGICTENTRKLIEIHNQALAEQP